MGSIAKMPTVSVVCASSASEHVSSSTNTLQLDEPVCSSRRWLGSPPSNVCMAPNTAGCCENEAEYETV